MAKCIGIWRKEQWNDETLEGLSKSVNTLNGQMHWHMMNWTMIWRNEKWNDEMNEIIYKGYVRVWNTLNGQVHWHMLKWTFT